MSILIETDATKQAFVLMVGKRFYNSHNKSRIVTAWSLAGACLFIEGTADKISDIEKIIQEKGYATSRKLVQLVD